VVADRTKQLAFIEGCNDAARLRDFLSNVRKNGDVVLADAAFKKLVAIVPGAEPGTLEHDFWQTINAFEQILTDERGRKTLLSRTRQKVDRVGIVATLTDWARSKKPSDGFEQLRERRLLELTGEAIVLRHADQFLPDVVAAAKARMLAAGVEIG
jgi:hypothetical protein